MLTAPQLPGYFPDLRRRAHRSALALVHSRFSTNTFPSWELAHPYRMIAHNGEINTLRGNVNWMRARESQLASELFGDDLAKVLPVVRPGGSDTANFDNVLELLVLAGRSLPHAMMMMIPEAYQGRDDLPTELKGFYAYHQCLMEAWDGPAAIAFTDGRVIGATLDRNGLRPGPLARDEATAGSCSPPRPACSTSRRRTSCARAGSSRASSSSSTSTAAGSSRTRRSSARSPTPAAVRAAGTSRSSRAARRPARAASRSERAARVAAPAPARVRLRAGGHEGDPRAARAERRGGRRLDGQRLAARRALRPQAAPLLVLQAALRPGDEPADRLDPRGGRDERAGERRLRAEPARRDARARAPARDRQPDPARLRARAACGRCDSAIFKARTLDITWPVAEGAAGMERALERVFAEADAALAAGANILILSDRAVGPERAHIPSLLAVSAVHHHLVREGTRLQAGLVLESGEARSVHSVATLVGYGAAAVNPYLMLETLARARRPRAPAGGDDAGGGAAPRGQGDRQGPAEDDVEDGHLDDAVVLRRADLRGRRPRARARRAPLHRHRRRASAGSGSRRSPSRRSRGTPARTRARPTRCCRSSASTPGAATASTTSGTRTRSPCSSTPSAHGGWETYEEYSRTVNAESARRRTIRGLLAFRFREDGGIPLDEVEPAAEIVKRFVHRRDVARLALARGARDARDRDEPDRRPLEHRRGRRGSGALHAATRTATRAARRSSRSRPGRFGVNVHYLTNADELQIKMAQGAKPGEGGQLPGPQGRPLHRGRPADDARRRPDLAAAAPRHLLDRGPEAADLRPALRESARRGSR